MTNELSVEDAISCLNDIAVREANLFEHILDKNSETYVQAVDMGIKALEQQNFKGKTNGDVIKAMFPNAEIIEIERFGYQYIYLTIDNLGSSWRIRKEWWNSPYKTESEE